ncbi:MAG TPA: metal ABC transporter permease [Thermoplasmata archaeon]|nr:metal ABC transporter permease [Thermoplasmata archaeon]
MTDVVLYSLIAGTFVGLAAGYIGSLMVLKRMALVGDALSHVALPGLALGILFHFNPFLGAFAFLFVAAVATWYLEQTTKLSVESIVGVLFVLALAIGILLTPEPDLLEALFGDVTTVTLEYAFAAVAVSVPVVLVTRLIYTQVVLSLVSDELARSTGIRVSLVNFLYLLLVAVVVAAGLQIVGTLLVGALVIVPAAAMKNVSSNLSRYAMLSGVAGVVSVVSGILISTAFVVPAGPLVVVVGFVVFLAATLAHRLVGYLREPPGTVRAPSSKGG